MPITDSQLDPIECSNEVGGGKVVTGELVVACGDASLILGAAEEVFDPIQCISIDSRLLQNPALRSNIMAHKKIRLSDIAAPI
jgi:hypothetical protein